MSRKDVGGRKGRMPQTTPPSHVQDVAETVSLVLGFSATTECAPKLNTDIINMMT